MGLVPKLKALFCTKTVKFACVPLHFATNAHMCVLFRVSTRSYPRRAPQPFFYVARSKPLSLI